MKLQRRSKKACRVLQESFNGVSRRINGCFNDVLSGFQWHLKEVQCVFTGSFKGVSRIF